MNYTPKKHPYLIAALGLALLFSLPIMADKQPPPNVVAITGQSDWSIIPPAIPSKYVAFHPDGSVTIRSMPLAGLISLTGTGIEIDGTGHGILNADLDATLSGPIYGPLTATTSLKGREKIAFEGSFFGRANGLLASGQILLEGRGHYAGIHIVVSFLETGPNTEVFTLTGHLLERHPDE